MRLRLPGILMDGKAFQLFRLPTAMMEGAVRRVLIPLFLLMHFDANAASVTTIKRMSDWQLTYDERSCDLAAKFGAGNDEVIAMFSRYGPSDWFILTLAGQPVKTSSLTSEVEVDFGPIENPRRAQSLNGFTAGLPSVSISSLRLDDGEFDGEDTALPSMRGEDEVKINTVKLTLPGKRVIQLHLGSMAKPMAAIRNCTDGLMQLWGLNPDEQKAVTARPKPSGEPRNWLRPSDYPDDMLRQGRSAISATAWISMRQGE